MTSTVNDQISDSVSEANVQVLGNAPSQSMAMVDTVMAETLGMLLHSAVNTQHHAQMTGNASVTAICARILRVPLPTPQAQPVPVPPPLGPEIPGPELGADIKLNYDKAQGALSALSQNMRHAEQNQEKARSLLQRLTDLARGNNA